MVDLGEREMELTRAGTGESREGTCGELEEEGRTAAARERSLMAGRLCRAILFFLWIPKVMTAAASGSRVGSDDEP